jgi:hypothetical protein
MPDYYVLVSVMDSQGGIEKKLCGHLYSTYHKHARDEAAEYAEKLNGGWPIAVLRGQFHTVTACPYSTVRSMRGFATFGKRRVTDKKWAKKKS